MDSLALVLLGVLVGVGLGVLLARLLRGGDEQSVRDSFAALSQQALTQAQQQFLDLAQARLAQQSAVATGDLESRRQAVDAVVAPLKDQLDAVTRSLSELEASRRGAYAGLSEQVRGLAEAQQVLRVETAQLTSALKAPAVRGRWGELQLRRVVELAGMVAHCDFDEQVHTVGEGGALRPDMVIRMPGNGSVVVDSKVPLEAFLMAGGRARRGDQAGRAAAPRPPARPSTSMP